MQAQRQEIVFIDASLADADSLLADLQAQRDAGRTLEIVRFGAGDDALALIGQTLAGRQGIDAVHVISHGSDGVLQLGAVQLDADTLLRRAGEIAAWSAALGADADLLLYGCDLAATGLGRELVADLAALTGADVAASIDATGAAALGGNWVLEQRTGAIETALAPSLAAQSQWQGLLATFTVTTTADAVGGSLLAGSLRWAISQANANAGTDTIVFAVDGTFSMTAGVSGDDSNATGDFDINGSVNIVGNGTGNTVINGNGVDRVFDVRSGSVSVSGLSIQGGKNSTGAGIQVKSGANLTLTDVVVQNNSGSGNSIGAGIYNDGSLTLRNVLVQNNVSSFGGSTDGAGIYVDSGASLDARDVEVRNNDAGGRDGGGVYLWSASAASLVNVTIANNQAYYGGGLFSHSTGATLVNVTLSGNSATAQGGGLWADRTVSLDHVTVAGNSVGTLGSGAGVYDKGGVVTTRNALYALNTGASNTNVALISQGYNLSDDNSAGFTATGDKKNTASGLSALASNGGFTRTLAISASSAARDGANPVTALATDQRGVAYIGGRADIGAYEYNEFGYAPTVSAIATQTINQDTALAALDFTVGDAETDASSLVVSATSSNTALVPNGSLVIGGSGSSRTISLTPTAAASGSSTITLSVSDGGNITTSSFVLTVNAPSVQGTLLFTTAAAQTTTAGGTTWAAGKVLQFGDAGDSFSINAGSTAGSITALPGFTAPQPIRSLEVINAPLTIGSGATAFNLARGDLLLVLDNGVNTAFTINTGVGTNTMSVTRQDILVYRPNAAGDYSTGVYAMLLQNGVHAGSTVYNVHALSLLQADTLVGDKLLSKGTFVVARSTSTEHNNVYTFTASATGSGTTVTSDNLLLLNGSTLGLPADQIQGLAVLSGSTAFNGTVLAPGTVLLTVKASTSTVKRGGCARHTL